MGNTSSLKSGSPEEQLTTACQFINEYQLCTNDRLSRSLITFCAHLSWYIYSPEVRLQLLPEFCTPISTQISSDKYLSQWSLIVLNKEILQLYETEYINQHQSENKEELEENVFTQLLTLDIDAVIVWKGADSDNIFDIFEGIGVIPDPIEFNDIYSNNLQSFLNHRNTLKKSDKRRQKIKRKLGISLTKSLNDDPIEPPLPIHHTAPIPSNKMFNATKDSINMMQTLHETEEEHSQDEDKHTNVTRNKKTLLLTTKSVSFVEDGAITPDSKKETFDFAQSRHIKPEEPMLVKSPTTILTSTDLQAIDIGSENEIEFKRQTSSSVTSKVASKSMSMTRSASVALVLSSASPAAPSMEKDKSPTHPGFKLAPSKSNVLRRSSTSYTDDYVSGRRNSRKRSSLMVNQQISFGDLSTRKTTDTYENEYDTASSSDEDMGPEDTVYNFNEYIDKIVYKNQPKKKKKVSNTKKNQRETELRMLEDKICESQLYSYDPVGIHAAIYATAKHDIYRIAHELNKHILDDYAWQQKIKSNKKINIMTTGHSLGGAIASAVVFRCLLQRHRNHIPSVLSPFIELTHAVSFGAGSIISYPAAEISNIHVHKILNKICEQTRAARNDCEYKHIDIETLDEFNTNTLKESSRLSPDTRRFLLEYNRRVHNIINNFDMMPRLPNVKFWRNQLIPIGLNHLILENRQLNEGLLGFIPQSKKKQQVDKLTNWLMTTYATHDGMFDSYSCFGNYYILIGGPTSFTASKLLGHLSQGTAAPRRPKVVRISTSQQMLVNTVSVATSEEDISKLASSAPSTTVVSVLPEQTEILLNDTHSTDIDHESELIDPIVFINYDSIPFVAVKEKRRSKNKKKLKAYYQCTASSVFAMSNFQARVLLSMAPEQLKENLPRIFHDHSIENYIKNLNPNFVFHHGRPQVNTGNIQRTMSLSNSESIDGDRDNNNLNFDDDRDDNKETQRQRKFSKSDSLQQSKTMNMQLIAKNVLSKNAAELFGSAVSDSSVLGSGYTVNHFYYQFHEKEIINGESEKYKNMLQNEKTFLIKSLNVTRTVKSLDLSNNGKSFGDEGARTLCEVLMKNKSIQNMNISANCISNVGAIFLGRLIDKNFSIRCLNLSNNLIEDDGAQQLADGLIHNKCLNQLIIFNNKFSSKGFMELTRIIAYNSNLRELILWEPF